MNIKFVKIALLFGGLLALAGSMSAETILVNVQVPFAFIAGGKLMPAGSYSIEEPGTAKVLILRGNAPGASAVALLVATEGPSSVRQAGVGFNRRGGEVVLSEVKVPGGLTYQLMPSESKLARLPLARR